MSREDIIAMAQEAIITHNNDNPLDFRLTSVDQLECFAQLVAAAEASKMQDRIETLHAMYEQACKQRDELMDQQRSMIAAMRGNLQ